MLYPIQAEELIQLFHDDQEEWKNFAQEEFNAEDKTALNDKKILLRQKVHERAERMLQILTEIGTPSLINIGPEGARAMSILALHDSLATSKKVLAAFILCYKNHRDDTYIQAIPSMTDWVLVLERKPQRFGTIWLLDENKEPFLPSVKDFENVNKRRAKYGIGPLHWPRSLAIPESSQPWLKRPLNELLMREPTQKEYDVFAKEYLD